MTSSHPSEGCGPGTSRVHGRPRTAHLQKSLHIRIILCLRKSITKTMSRLLYLLLSEHIQESELRHDPQSPAHVFLHVFQRRRALLQDHGLRSVRSLQSFLKPRNARRVGFGDDNSPEVRKTSLNAMQNTRVQQTNSNTQYIGTASLNSQHVKATDTIRAKTLRSSYCKRERSQ